ncbi:hypothetical protein BKA62DRAFT_698563 [Auriculariales sp. MPI-PUGE-AT-0066]|nr:hypothetical protein BKA62DRAFT_698563 [Auriculariales sp. MPI-PUGE-AT-0066]
MFGQPSRGVPGLLLSPFFAENALAASSSSFTEPCSSTTTSGRVTGRVTSAASSGGLESDIVDEGKVLQRGRGTGRGTLLIVPQTVPHQGKQYPETHGASDLR